MRLVVGIALFGGLFWLVVAALRAWIRLRFPPRIPPDLAFEHELRSERALREVAELLAKRFPGPTSGVACLGPVRGSAARLLFHSGPENRGRNRNIHRPDYVLEVVRRERRIVLQLRLNRPYSYLRLRRREIEPLVRVLRDVYGKVTEV